MTHKFFLIQLIVILISFNLFASECEKAVKIILPLDSNSPSNNFIVSKDYQYATHLTQVIYNDPIFDKLCKVYNYSKDAIPGFQEYIYLALYHGPSAYGVPYVTTTDYFPTNVNSTPIKGAVYHLSLTDIDGRVDGLTDGIFQNGFFHEVGHVLLKNLVQNYPVRTLQSSGSSSVTNGPVAFDEGFAIFMELLLSSKLDSYWSDHYLAGYEAFWYKTEFGHFRPYGIINNIFVWDDWNDLNIYSVIEEGGHELIYQDDFLKKENLRTLEQMLTNEGTIAGLLLKIVGVMSTVDQDFEVDYLTTDLHYIYPSLVKLTSFISKYSITNMSSFLENFFKDEEMRIYSLKVLDILLETTYYAYGSKDYNQKYIEHKHEEISEDKYIRWKAEVYNTVRDELGI